MLKEQRRKQKKVKKAARMEQRRAKAAVKMKQSCMEVKLLATKAAIDFEVDRVKA